jgi:putative hydrolases of HD superfamily
MLKTIMANMAEKGCLTPESVPVLLDLAKTMSRKKRRGWLLRGIPEELAESVYEHTIQLRQGCISYAVGRAYDPVKVFTLSDVHDLVECIAPDWTPHDGISPEEKRKGEEAAIIEVSERLRLGRWLVDEWHDYERRESPEALLVYELDKADPVIKAQAYKNNFDRIVNHYLGHGAQLDALVEVTKLPAEDALAQCRRSLDEFYPYAREKVSNPDLIGIMDRMQGYSGKDIYRTYFRELMTTLGRFIAKMSWQSMSPLEQRMKTRLFNLRTFS